jgi:ammonia channel protein AmtB
MLLWLWKVVRNSKNRQILTWAGGGVVVIVAGLWAAFVYLFPLHKPSESVRTDVQANCGGVAIGGSVTGTTITGGTMTSSDCSTNSKQGAAP